MHTEDCGQDDQQHKNRRKHDRRNKPGGDLMPLPLLFENRERLNYSRRSANESLAFRFCPSIPA